MLTLELLLFFIFSGVAVMAAIAVIFSKNAVHSALFLLLNFIMLAGLYILMSAQFIAALQVIVYAGAIVVLILFVIMLLGAELGESVPTWFTPKNMFVALLSLIFIPYIQQEDIF